MVQCEIEILVTVQIDFLWVESVFLKVWILENKAVKLLKCVNTNPQALDVGLFLKYSANTTNNFHTPKLQLMHLLPAKPLKKLTLET